MCKQKNNSFPICCCLQFSTKALRTQNIFQEEYAFVTSLITNWSQIMNCLMSRSRWNSTGWSRVTSASKIFETNLRRPQNVLWQKALANTVNNTITNERNLFELKTIFSSGYIIFVWSDWTDGELWFMTRKAACGFRKTFCDIIIFNLLSDFYGKKLVWSETL